MDDKLQLQNELSLVWASRLKKVSEIGESGKRFSISKQMHNAMSFAPINYSSMVSKVRRRLRLLRRQMNAAQQEMNELMKFKK